MEINGKPVLNGKKRWMLSIDQVDIKGGRNKDPGGCAAARAILREHKEIKSVRVHIGRIFVEHEKHWERFQTPESLRSEVVAFDRGGSFMPGTHTIRPLSPSGLRSLEGAYQENRKEPRKSGKKKIARARQYNIHGVRARGATR